MKQSKALWVAKILLTLHVRFGFTSSRLSRLRKAPVLLPHARQSCFEFVEYLPSHWEDKWLSEAKRLTSSACDLMQKDNSSVKAWIQDDILAAPPPQHTKHAEEVWSFFKYRNACPDASSDFTFVPIEPAVGLLRHPLAPPCYAGQTTLDVEDRGYLMPATVSQILTNPGRRLLFDMGCGSSFASSLQWFVDTYKQRGATFDEIWCWEPSQMDHHTFWSSVPGWLVSKLHFYNTFAVAGSNASAPLGILQAEATSADFVVLKLDIDNDDLEDQIMQSMLEVRHLIGELYFEKHFDILEMQPYFGEGLKSSLYDVLTMFRQLRHTGLRLHYWP